MPTIKIVAYTSVANYNLSLAMCGTEMLQGRLRKTQKGRLGLINLMTKTLNVLLIVNILKNLLHEPKHLCKVYENENLSLDHKKICPALREMIFAIV